MRGYGSAACGVLPCPVPQAVVSGASEPQNPLVLMRYFLPYKHLSLSFWGPAKAWEGGCLL